MKPKTVMDGDGILVRYDIQLRVCDNLSLYYAWRLGLLNTNLITGRICRSGVAQYKRS